MVVALLAILQGGAAFVPLDPSYPINRLQYMIADAGIEYMLSHKPHLQLLDHVDVIDLDSIARTDATFEPKAVVDQQLAYMIYTSGTTGSPKGVMINHGNVKNITHAMSNQFDTEQGHRATWLAVTSMSFDISVVELLWTLSRGDHVVIEGKDATIETESIVTPAEQLITEHKISSLQCTPSFIYSLVEQSDVVSQLDTVVLGGEVFSDSLLKALKEKQVKNIYNMYGPTETTIYCAGQKYDGQSDSMMIGNPIANTTLLLLDQNHQVVPRGVIGELYIAGLGLARGYKDKPGLTAQQFLPNPWGKISGERMYRTGDLMRYRLDGCLEFVGRIDNQIKVRGYRIEIDEIEGAIARFDGIRKVVVAAVGEGISHRKIVAYLEIKDEVSRDIAGVLRDYLKLHIPSFMIPSHFVMLDQLPLTPSGKIDRKQLVEITLDNKDRKLKPFEKPQSLTEQKVAAIWQQLLEISEISRVDDFFEIGGHSLMLVEMQKQCSASLGRKLTVIELLKYPTIASFSEFIDSNITSGNLDSTNNAEKAKARASKQRMALKNNKQNRNKMKQRSEDGQPA
jgi:amino acid adenylation domain-containing protein